MKYNLVKTLLLIAFTCALWASPSAYAMGHGGGGGGRCHVGGNCRGDRCVSPGCGHFGFYGGVWISCSDGCGHYELVVAEPQLTETVEVVDTWSIDAFGRRRVGASHLVTTVVRPAVLRRVWVRDY